MVLSKDILEHSGLLELLRQLQLGHSLGEELTAVVVQVDVELLEDDVLYLTLVLSRVSLSQEVE